ncbi:MAG: VTT domain-containing protein [Anaerolineales bacterium]|nr:MAG: VTT domain-containing protein [Anaerolineales bacterium]
MSTSKKANKKVSPKKSKSVQKKGKKTSARSSRVEATKKPKVRISRQKIQVEPAVKSLAPAAKVAKKPKVRVSRQKVWVEPVDESPVPAVETPQSSLQTNLLRVLALGAVVVITVYIFSIRERVAQFSEFGYPGIFLIALLANATILLPAPGAAVIYAMGAVFHPLGVGIAAGTGGALGELSGYLAGFSGQAVVERMDVYERMKPWVDKYGGWAILVLSAIPNPFFDAAGIAAGIAKMPLRTFLFFVWIGQLIKMTMFAYAGKYSLDWLAQFIK